MYGREQLVGTVWVLTQVIRFGGKHLYLLSYLASQPASPSFEIFFYYDGCFKMLVGLPQH